MRIEVICTGDEVLTGKVVNTNFSYITQKLEDCGLAVEWETTVGDDRDNLLLAFQLAGQRADAVIVNGGLGPTVDDLSQEIAAKAAGVELKLNEQWPATMEDYFKRRSRIVGGLKFDYQPRKPMPQRLFRLARASKVQRKPAKRPKSPSKVPSSARGVERQRLGIDAAASGKTQETE